MLPVVDEDWAPHNLMAVIVARSSSGPEKEDPVARVGNHENSDSSTSSENHAPDMWCPPMPQPLFHTHTLGRLRRRWVRL